MMKAECRMENEHTENGSVILQSSFCILPLKKGPGAANGYGRPQGPPGPCHFNKEQTPLGDLLDPNPRFHGGCFGVWGHTSSEALQM
jgi:hypothetical protein